MARKKQENVGADQASAKPAAKARKAPARKAASAKKSSRTKKAATRQQDRQPSDDEIRIRAYFIAEWRQKEEIPGDAADDWIEARRQLLAEADRDSV